MTSEENHTKDKKTWCVFKKPKIVPEVYVHSVPSFDFGKALGEKYPLLRLVFNYVSYEDLQSCAGVNDLWKMYAVEAMKARTVITPGWFSLAELKEGEYQLECNTYHDMACGLLFCEKSFHQTKTICLHEGEDFQKLDALEGVRKKLVGDNVPFIICYGLSVESLSNTMMMTGLIIPKLPNVIVERICGWSDDQIMYEVNERIFQKNLEVRALLVFDRFNRAPQYFRDEILKKQKEKVYALCGGIVRYNKSDLTLQEKPRKKGQRPRNVKLNILAIGAPPESTNFEAYSAICTSHLHHKQFFEDIKARITLKKHAVVVACVCINIADDVDWMEVLDEHFPNIPTTCMAVEGEYGWEKLDTPVTPDYEDRCGHENTFSLCIMTWD